MKKYIVNKITPGEPERYIMEINARSAAMAWASIKSLFIHGTFYIFPAGDYKNGIQYSK